MWLHRLQKFPDLPLNPIDKVETTLATLTNFNSKKLYE